MICIPNKIHSWAFFGKRKRLFSSVAKFVADNIPFQLWTAWLLPRKIFRYCPNKIISRFVCLSVFSSLPPQNGGGFGFDGLWHMFTLYLSKYHYADKIVIDEVRKWTFLYFSFLTLDSYQLIRFFITAHPAKSKKSFHFLKKFYLIRSSFFFSYCQFKSFTFSSLM